MTHYGRPGTIHGAVAIEEATLLDDEGCGLQVRVNLGTRSDLDALGGVDPPFYTARDDTSRSTYVAIHTPALPDQESPPGDDTPGDLAIHSKRVLEVKVAFQATALPQKSVEVAAAARLETLPHPSTPISMS